MTKTKAARPKDGTRSNLMETSFAELKRAFEMFRRTVEGYLPAGNKKRSPPAAVRDNPATSSERPKTRPKRSTSERAHPAQPLAWVAKSVPDVKPVAAVEIALKDVEG